MRTAPLLLAMLLYANAAHADPDWQLRSANGRKASDIASWGTAITAMALDTKTSWDCADRRKCFELQGVRVGVTYGLTFLAKTLVHRRRPCAPDCGSDNPDYSFFSAHTAITFSTIGGARLAITVPLATGTGALRVTAGKHWITDVLTGAGVGLLTSRIR